MSSLSGVWHDNILSLQLFFPLSFFSPLFSVSMFLVSPSTEKKLVVARSSLCLSLFLSFIKYHISTQETQIYTQLIAVDSL